MVRLRVGFGAEWLTRRSGNTAFDSDVASSCGDVSKTVCVACVAGSGVSECPGETERCSGNTVFVSGVVRVSGAVLRVVCVVRCVAWRVVSGSCCVAFV